MAGQRGDLATWTGEILDACSASVVSCVLAGTPSQLTDGASGGEGAKPGWCRRHIGLVTWRSS